MGEPVLNGVLSEVRASLSEQEAAVRVVLNNPAVEFSFIPFKFVISVHPSAYRGA